MIENANNENHPIPPMTHPLSRHWNQPDRSEILIDETHAVMTTGTFRKLPEYSCTNPTGVYPGKMWKGNENFRGQLGEDRWFLAWYGDEFEEGGSKYVSNNYRQIILI